MGQTPGDDKTEPTLELPSLRLPRLGRRKQTRATPAGAEEPVEDTSPPDVPVGEPAPEPAAAPEPESRPAAETWPEADATAEPAPQPERAHASAPTPQPTSAPEGARRRRAAKTPALTAPSIPGRLAAGLTGLLVGGAGAAATYGAMEGCEEVRGVSTCGGAPGFFILVAIVVLMVLLGSVILKALRVADTASTSFLAVGIVTVVVMLTLLDEIFSPWMFAVIPVLTAAAFVLAHWVTTRFEHEDTGRRDWT